MLSGLIDFVFPSSCAVCGAKPSMLCRDCAPSPNSGSFTHKSVPGRYLFDYSDLAPVLRDFKDKSMVAHAKFLANQIDPIIEQLLGEKDFDSIAIPGSSKLNFKRRGFIPAKLVLKRCPAVKKRDMRILVMKRTRETKDQRTLKSPERKANTANSMSVGDLLDKRVLLFDDVFTTGATVSEMIRAVRSAGGEPSDFCVLAKRI